MNRTRAACICGFLTLVLVACSSNSGASATPTPSPTPSPTPTAAASAAAGSAQPSLNLPSNAKELEALLPNTLGGATLTKASMKGSDFVNQQTSSPELVAWLNSLGKSLNDISAAYAFDLSGTTQAAIFAFRVAGVDHTTLISGLKQAVASGAAAQTWTSANVGGKSVETTKASGTTETTYLYGTADIVFFVESSDPALAAEALSHLP